MRLSFFAMMISCCLLVACEKNKHADQTKSKITAETSKTESMVDEIIVEQKSANETTND